MGNLLKMVHVLIRKLNVGVVNRENGCHQHMQSGCQSSSRHVAIAAATKWHLLAVFL